MSKTVRGEIAKRLRREYTQARKCAQSRISEGYIVDAKLWRGNTHSVMAQISACR